MTKYIKCGKCLENCPTGNITYENGKYVFYTKCTLCARCSFFCPADAISLGLLNGWRVNGAYPLEALERDETVVYPYIDRSDKGLCRLYRGYFRDCDRKLERAGMRKELGQ